jgi:predicted RecB family nuclease
MAGLQCDKRLYLECFHPELADPFDPGRQAILDMGTRVGELARDLCPDCQLITEDHLHHGKAVSSTETVLADPKVNAISEAAFVHDDVRIRVDILERSGKDRYDLIEVKSGTSVKEEHIPDVAVQLYVLRGCGIPVEKACLCHLNKQYVYQGGDYDLSQLFLVEDITSEVEELQPYIPLLLEEMRLPLWQLEPPDIKPRRQCTKPYPCVFYSHCHAGKPEHHVSQLPRATEKLLSALEEAGIEDIREMPIDFPGLNATQQRVRDCLVGNNVYLDPLLPRTLEKLEYPIHFLDFETFNPALPLYVGTRPYHILPFQWSDHVLTEDGEIRHQEFLYDGFDDPREPFARSLVDALGSSGSIVVYSSFEATRIRELAVALPHLSGELLNLLEGRIVDLLELVRKHCYHPDFHGSFSLKAVLPALVPELDYSDLEISDGTQASMAYAEIIQAETPDERRRQLRENLLTYCKRDTEAEVRLFEMLKHQKV